MTHATLRRRFRSFMQKRAPLMMTCREFETFVTDYLDGTLSFLPRLIFRLHIVFCRECRDYLATYRRTIAASKSAFDDPSANVSDEVPEELVDAVLAARRFERDP